MTSSARLDLRRGLVGQQQYSIAKQTDQPVMFLQMKRVVPAPPNIPGGNDPPPDDADVNLAPYICGKQNRQSGQFRRGVDALVDGI